MGKKTSYTRAPPLACRDDSPAAWPTLGCFRPVRQTAASVSLPTLATVDPDGQPHARIVVLRDCNVEERWLRFNTDLRSPKVSQIEANPRGALHFYDKFHKIQLRLKVRLELLEDAALADVWDGVQHYSRECYQITKAPGLPGVTAGCAGRPRAHQEGATTTAASQYSVHRLALSVFATAQGALFDFSDGSLSRVDCTVAPPSTARAKRRSDQGVGLTILTKAVDPPGSAASQEGMGSPDLTDPARLGQRLQTAASAPEAKNEAPGQRRDSRWKEA